MTNVDGEITLKAGFDSREAKKDIQNLAKAIQDTFSKFNMKGATSSMIGLQNQINKVTADLEKAKAKQEELAKTPVYSDEYIKAEKDLDIYNAKLDETKTKMLDMRRQLSQVQATPVQSAKYTEISENLAKTDAQYARLKQRAQDYYETQRKLKVESEDIDKQPAYQKLGAQLQMLDERAAQFRAQLAQLKAEGKDVTIIPRTQTTAYRDIALQLRDLRSEYDQTRRRAIELENVTSGMRFAGTANTPGSQTQAYRDTSNQVNQLEGRLAQLVARYQEAGTVAQKSGNKQSLGAAVAKKAWGGFRGSLNAIGKGISKLKKDSVSSFNDITKSAKSMFWKILKYSLSIRSLYALIRKLRATFSNSIKVMGMDIPRIRDELNSLINGFTQVKYSLATAFQPIFSYIVPALNTLISALNSAMIALANFFATFTGQKVIYKATKQNKDYAESISGAGSAAADANEDIAEYDKLIVINQDKAGGGGGGGGDTGLDTGIFEEVPSKINEFAQLIKDAWKKSDFTEVGAYIGNKLKTGLESIKWGPIKQTARNVGRSFATLINGFVNVPELGTRIGTTLSNALNTAWLFVNEFVKTLDWSGVGKFIGDSIVGFLTNLDLATLGENLALGLNGIATTIMSVFATINQNLPRILENITRGIDTFLDNFDPELIGGAFGQVSKAILDFVNGILPEIPKITSKLGDLFNSLVKNFPSEKFAKTVSGLLRTAIKGATQFIQKVDFEELGKKIGEFIANLDLMGVATDLAKLLWEVVKAAFKALPGLISEAPLETALIGAFALMKFSKWGSAFAGKLGGALSTSLLGEAFTAKLSGALTKLFSWTGVAGAAIIAAIAGWKIGDAIYNILPRDNTGDNFVDNAVDFLLGGDPRKVVKEATAGLDFKSIIYEELQNPYYQVRQEVEKLGLTGKEAYNYLATELDKIDVDSFIEANKTGAAEVDEAARDMLNSWKEEQLAAAEAKYGVEEVQKTYNGMPSTVADAMNKSNASLTSGIGELETQAENVIKSYNGMPSDVQSQIEKSNNVLYQHFESLKTQFTDIRKVLEGTPEDVAGKIEEVNSTLAKSFSDLWGKTEEVKQSYNGMPSEVQEKIESTNGELSTSFEGLKGKVDEISKSIETIGIKNGFESLKNQVQDLKDKTDDYKKSIGNAGTKTTKTTKKLTDSFETVANKVNTLKEKTDDYNSKLQATSDVVSKSLEDTANKSQNIGTSMTRAFTKIKNSITNVAGEVNTTWYNKVTGAVSDANKKLEAGISNLGKDSLNALASALTDNSIVLTNASNLGDNINSAISNPFKGENGVASILKQSLVEVAQDKDGTITGDEQGFGSLGNKIRTAMGNLFDKLGLKNDYQEAISELDKLEKDKDSGGIKGIAYRVMDYWRTKMFQMKNATINAYTQGKDKVKDTEDKNKGLKKIAADISDYWGKKFVLVRKAMINAYDKGLAHYQNGESGGGFTQIASGIQSAFSKIKAEVTGNDSVGNSMVNNLTGAWKTIVDYFNNGKALTDASDTIRNSFSGTADDIIAKFGQAYQAILNMFGNATIQVNVTDNIKSALIGALQNLAYGVNNVFSNFVESFNNLADKINNSNFFTKIGSKIYHLATSDYQIPIPGAAKGAVIPPNKEFLAILGDQKQGTNIETPLQTMIDAFNTALDRRGGNSSSNSAPIVLQLNGKEIARAVWDEDAKKYRQTGRYSPNYL